MNEISVPDNAGKTLIKAAIVVLYTMMGISTAVSPVPGTKLCQFPAELIPHFETPACLLVGVVLIAGILLGIRGKASASWAVIAYGSLCVALLKFMASSHWYAKDRIQQQWIGMGIATLLVLLLVGAGLHAAYHGRWKQMTAWSLLVHLGLFLYMPVLVYAQYFYCQRHSLPLQKAK